MTERICSKCGHLEDKHDLEAGYSWYLGREHFYPTPCLVKKCPCEDFDCRERGAKETLVLVKQIGWLAGIVLGIILLVGGILAGGVLVLVLGMMNPLLWGGDY